MARPQENGERIRHIFSYHRALAVPLLLLAACSPSAPENARGTIFGVTEGSVTISGPAQRKSLNFFYEAWDDAQPTEAMVEQAREVCPNATFVSSEPNTADLNSVLYVFRC